MTLIGTVKTTDRFSELLECCGKKMIRRYLGRMKKVCFYLIGFPRPPRQDHSQCYLKFLIFASPKFQIPEFQIRPIFSRPTILLDEWKIKENDFFTAPEVKVKRMAK